jgi:hypothetical protein
MAAGFCCLCRLMFQMLAGDGSEIVDIMHAVKPNAKAEVMFPASCNSLMESGRKLLVREELQNVRAAGAANNAFELIVLQSNTNAMKLGCTHSRKYETTSKEQK